MIIGGVKNANFMDGQTLSSPARTSWADRDKFPYHTTEIMEEISTNFIGGTNDY